MNSFMKLTKLAYAAALCTAPFVLAPVTAAETSDDKKAQAEKPELKTEEETKKEDKRICRYVRLDASSRRKTKVCRTKEGWRELNNPR